LKHTEGSHQWAQDKIQSAYKQYGLKSDHFNGELRWYLAFRAVARKMPTKILRDLDLYSLTDFLSEHEKDGISAFYLQLCCSATRSIHAKWHDQGIPIYHWINRSFHHEMKKVDRNEFGYRNHHVSYVENPGPFDDFSAQPENRITVIDPLEKSKKRPLKPYNKPRPADDYAWKTDDEKAQDDVIHVEEDDIDSSVILHSQALNQFESQSPSNAAIVKALRAIGRANYSAIARMVSEMGFPINHDAVRRRIIKLVESVKAAKALQDLEHSWYQYSDHNRRSKAAREAVIPATVPKFVRREFDREGPLTVVEHRNWANQTKQPPVRPGLTHSVVTVELPEDTGAYWSHTPPSRKPTR
jgi:hypothetical protein